MVSHNQVGQQDSIPQRLYHYTSLESLALILKYKTIRLMPITGMDDLQEARTSDVPNLGRFVFASSWTDDKKESIPMWNMYASLESGVRICLPTMPFKRYQMTAEELSQQTGMPVDHIDTSIKDMQSFLPLSDLARGLTSPAFMGGQGVLVKVEYTSDKDLLEPKVCTLREDGMTNINIGMLGKYKNEYWRFQHEWRYQLQILPINAFDVSEEGINRMMTKLDLMLRGVLPAPCPHYDLRISDEAMDKFEIVASPKMSDGNRVLLDMLLKHHGLTETLRPSELTGLL